MNKLDLSFYKGKVVLITGHTGFKGSWLSKILVMAGAKVVGYALNPPTEPNLFNVLGLKEQITSIEGDIRDYKHLKEVFDEYRPEIVIHLAAQPLVIDSYEKPLYTYETNALGTANVMECVRLSDSVISVLNVTTDKVYFNPELVSHGFKEDEPLDGDDPYSNSKSCSELITHSYKKSFFNGKKLAVSTARAGNVIGGGDFATNRIIPDAVRAIISGEPLIVRHPLSVRPYQHVLEPLYVYLLILMKQAENYDYAGYYNVGPDVEDCLTSGELITRFSKAYGEGLTYELKETPGVHEANYLRLDCTKLKNTFAWTPNSNIDDALELVAKWTKAYLVSNEEAQKEAEREVRLFFAL